MNLYNDKIKEQLIALIILYGKGLYSVDHALKLADFSLIKLDENGYIDSGSVILCLDKLRESYPFLFKIKNIHSTQV